MGAIYPNSAATIQTSFHEAQEALQFARGCPADRPHCTPAAVVGQGQPVSADRRIAQDRSGGLHRATLYANRVVGADGTRGSAPQGLYRCTDSQAARGPEDALQDAALRRDRR